WGTVGSILFWRHSGAMKPAFLLAAPFGIFVGILVYFLFRSFIANLSNGCFRLRLFPLTSQCFFSVLSWEPPILRLILIPTESPQLLFYRRASLVYGALRLFLC